VLESLFIEPISIKQFEPIARAQKIEFKVCNDEYEATPDKLEDIRDFYSKVTDLIAKRKR